ncbi:T6SS phospholipase effector Tle1-like catalytic domain-containing protein [Iodobacter arcticus]|uniref:T6SS phospholipase effector Tle1-like catalytic domain-containing protein n=1 Tax=Iodobacter arcticus TaxID=590593 RepID=A0ABW2QZI4_9NEIS
MSARFSSECREDPLKLVGPEDSQRTKTQNRPKCLPCEQDIYLGFFFDGTNNNKYRDTDAFAHSNVARLYEAYSGEPTVAKLKVLKQAAKADAAAAWSSVIPKDEKKYYRKTYIPGVGTPFIELGDTGEGADNTLGLAMSKHGEVRINWALLQVSNHIHAAIMGAQFSDPLKDDAELATEMLDETARDRGSQYSIRAPSRGRGFILQDRSQKLAKAIAPIVRGSPTIRSVRLSVFGFSRGAAEARVFCSWLQKYYSDGIAGISLKIDFLGIFDTVASVGLANSVPIGGVEGHYVWASVENLQVSSAVKRCVHLVSAHEVRGSFPLDSIGSGAQCKEVVYPGVHSDVGGGYPPNDQGRSIGVAAAGDAKKLSQIPLAQMYREALIASVPLLGLKDFNDFHQSNFKIDPGTVKAFNDYIAATRVGSGKPSGVMWLTETQVEEPLLQIIHRHYGIFLRWRKSMLGKVHLLAGMSASLDSAPKKTQDRHDLQTTDLALQQELNMLEKYTPLVSELSIWPAKVADWNEGVFAEWTKQEAVLPASKVLFETLVHDSRAWFKPSNFSDDDQVWFNEGGMEKTRTKMIKSIEAEQERVRSPYRLSDEQMKSVDNKDYQENIERIEKLKTNKTYPVRSGGQEPIRLYGYLRWRHVFGASALPASPQDPLSKEKARKRELENQQHENNLQSLNQQNSNAKKRYQEGQINAQGYGEALRDQSLRMSAERQRHAAAIGALK